MQANQHLSKIYENCNVTNLVMPCVCLKLYYFFSAVFLQKNKSSRQCRWLRLKLSLVDKKMMKFLAQYWVSCLALFEFACLQLASHYSFMFVRCSENQFMKCFLPQTMYMFPKAKEKNKDFLFLHGHIMFHLQLYLWLTNRHRFDEVTNHIT